MNTKNLSTSALLTIALMSLAACGGGGGGDNSTSTTPVAKTCANGAADYPTCTPPVIPASLQQALPANYAPGSPQSETFIALNDFRRSIGLGPVNQNTMIDKAALNHHIYAVSSWIYGEDAHTQVPGRPNFTGVTFLDRIKAAGFTDAVGGTEVLDAENGKFGIDILATAILHRQGMMMESLTDVGIYSDAGTIIDFGYSKGQSNASDFIGIYPVDKQTGLYWNAVLEAPNPFSDLEMTRENMCKQTSYPISIQSQASTRLTVSSFTVKEYGSTLELPTRLLAPGSPNIYNNFAAIVGKAPFKPNTTYVVQFVGRVSGGKASTGFDVTKNWSFTTGPKNYLNCA